jgi:chromosome segregation and condensation protein ScpB
MITRSNNMPGSDRISLQFIQEINSQDVRQSIETLGRLIENLESKSDPEPIEIEIVSNAYQLVEQFNTLENLLKQYTTPRISKLSGNKLDSLYDSNPNGTSILFK